MLPVKQAQAWNNQNLAPSDSRDLKVRLTELEKMCISMKKEIDELQYEIKILRSKKGVIKNA